MITDLYADLEGLSPAERRFVLDAERAFNNPPDPELEEEPWNDEQRRHIDFWTWQCRMTVGTTDLPF